MPTETRSVLSVIPAPRRASAVIDAWLIVSGCSIRDSTPPNDSAIEYSLVVVITFSAFAWQLRARDSANDYTNLFALVTAINTPDPVPTTLPIADVEERRDIGSLMPADVVTAMPPAQQRDLIRYLLELGRTPGLESLTHRVAPFAPAHRPLRPDDWPNATEFVNRERVYDF